MNRFRRMATAALLALLIPTLAAADPGTPVLSENVTGGTLDLVWEPTFGLPPNVYGVTLPDTDPAYANPSGDHTVLNAPNSDPIMGGLNKSVTNSGGFSDYSWEGYLFTGDGSTRRGIVLRATGTPGDLNNCYQFVIEQGLLQLNFRKLVDQVPTTLGSWFTTDTPSGFPGQDVWVHLKVEAIGSQFRVYYNGFELTDGAPIVDSQLPGGWVGVYNFNFAVGFVPCYFDDLTLCSLSPVSVEATSWAGVKDLYR